MSEVGKELERIQEELNCLRHQNRRLKWGLLGVGLAFLVVISFGMAVPEERVLKADQVEAKRLVMKDDKGRERVVIAMAESDVQAAGEFLRTLGKQSLIVIKGEKGETRAEIGSNAASSFLLLCDEKSRCRVQAYSHKTGAVEIVDEEGKSRAEMGVFRKKGHFRVKGGLMKILAELGSSDDGGSLALMDKNRKTPGVWAACKKGGSSFELLDQEDNARIRLACGLTGVSVVAVKDKENKTTANLMVFKEGKASLILTGSGGKPRAIMSVGPRGSARGRLDKENRPRIMMMADDHDGSNFLAVKDERGRTVKRVP